ncbi:putative MFS family arabinose efflux permease [Acinetobacter calcoaceticus]|uniref:Putative MFS family arabinose efflux permease n=1 Tax=Acinetobacter calcoaceticus TaxID=471 RepID=A0A4R1XYL1_ACICA|nr:putative MFS family arabinose efflux permease [Acinetobacter calcoaceticus]
MKQTVDSKLHIFAIFLYAAICPFVLMSAPVIAQQLAKEWQLSPSQVGMFFFLELGMMSFATIPAYYWTKKITMRKATLYSVGLFLLGNVLSLFASSYEFLLFSRLISAFGGGTLMIITISSCSLTAKPDNSYGFWVLGQVLLGAAALYFMPKLYVYWGLNASFFLAVILILIALPFYRYFADFFIEKEINNVVASNQNTTFGAVSILATLLFFIAVGGVWTFMSSIGDYARIDSDFIHSVLAISNILGIIGCFLPAVIGDKLERKYFLTFGYILFFIALSLLIEQITRNGLMVAILLFKFSWMFTIPFVLASVASFDVNGRLLNSINLVAGCGLAIGPVLAGRIIENTGSFSALIVYSIALFLLSFILIYICTMKKVEITKMEMG